MTRISDPLLSLLVLLNGGQHQRRATHFGAHAFASARRISRCGCRDNRPLLKKFRRGEKKRAMQRQVQDSVVCHDMSLWSTTSHPEAQLSSNGGSHSEDDDGQIVPWKQSCAHRKYSRRGFFSNCLTTAIVSAGGPTVATAVDVDDRWTTKLNRLVTQSDLGISVRKSIVRGAQVMDRIDRSWEQFSDAYGLGYQRSQQTPFPQPRKDIPASPRPLDTTMANALLDLFDETFLSLVPSVRTSDLQDRIRRLQELVRPSFERASSLEAPGGALFNFDCYTRFRVYNEILGEFSTSKKQVQNLTGFRRKWEDEVGRGIIQLLLSLPSSTPTTDASSGGDGTGTDDRETAIRTALTTIDHVNEALQSRGFVSLAVRNTVDADRWQDFLEELDYLPLTLEVYGDVTLQSQILLQEQGYRFVYPALCRWAAAAALRQSPLSASWKVSTEEYYMDTQYNANPEDYQVREILVNVVVE